MRLVGRRLRIAAAVIVCAVGGLAAAWEIAGSSASNASTGKSYVDTDSEYSVGYTDLTYVPQLGQTLPADQAAGLLMDEVDTGAVETTEP